MSDKTKPARKLSGSSLRRESSKSNVVSGSKAKKQVEELTNENTRLKNELDNISKENLSLKNKLGQVIGKVVESCTCEEKTDYEITDTTDMLDVPVDDVMDIISKLVTKKLVRNRNTIEGRIEDMETRITEQNMQVATLLKTRSILEEGLFELAQCPTIFHVKQKVELLQVAIEEPTPITVIDTDNPPVCSDHTPNHQAELIADLQKTSLLPPSRRLPGDTHIRYMHKDLKSYVVKDLSLLRNSKQDWRTLAIRVGIPSETVENWEKSHIESPMMEVLSYWGRSNAATVRMLHRHLCSPQMRSLLVAKKISSFYEID